VNSVRLPPLDLLPEQARGVGHWPVPAGEDKQSLAPMGRADFRRREESRRKAVAHADQASGDLGEAEAEMMADVLQKDEGRLALGNDARDVRPEMAFVFRPPPPAGDRERLARIARKDDVHRATPRAAIEGSDIVPDRSRIQGRHFHPGHENGRRIGFPFDVTHGPVSVGASRAIIGIGGKAAKGEMQPEIESASAGAERESEEPSFAKASEGVPCGALAKQGR
jgi:hypothetical protein